MSWTALTLTAILSIVNGDTDGMTRLQDKCFIENLIYESVGEDPEAVRNVAKELNGEFGAADKNNPIGMRLTAEIVLNRLEEEHRGEFTLCSVIYDDFQFSWTRKPKSELRKYTREEYLAAAQVAYTYLYTNADRLLPVTVINYLNPKTSKDMSWYDPDKVVYKYRNHHYLQL